MISHTTLAVIIILGDGAQLSGGRTADKRMFSLGFLFGLAELINNELIAITQYFSLLSD